MRIASLKREAYEFKRDVVIAGENPRTGKIMVEKVTRYFEDAQRNRDAMLDKLRLKIGSLRAQQSKLESSLHQKEEVGDVLHYIDFHQLQIENKQYLAKIEEKNAELLRLKISTGHTIQVLNAMKAQLSDVGKHTNRLRGDIKTRTVLLRRLRKDNGSLAATVAKQHELGVTLSRLAKEAADMPTILDYVQLKALQATLTHEATSWARKLEVMDLTAKQSAIKTGRVAMTAYVDTLAAAPIRSTVRLHSAGAGGINVKVLGAASGAPGTGDGRLGATAASATLSTLGASGLGAKTRATGARPYTGGSFGGTLGSTGMGAGAGAGVGLAHSPIRVPLPPPARGVGGFGGTTSKGAGTLRLGSTAATAAVVRRGGGIAGGTGGGPAGFGSTARR